jgi:hypothetical protein
MMERQMGGKRGKGKRSEDTGSEKDYRTGYQDRARTVVGMKKRFGIF